MADIRLDAQRYQELLKAERDLLDLIPTYDRLEECGQDCSGLREVNAATVEKIAKIKQHFPPRARL
jgi:hypothetical protein